ncbi:DNA internalization-related competence protein ComEC/Rec2 [Desulfoluna spongiiphila]|uniref:DNA internalization-related competence protein ComEC/Rec2 n=1 Tax=Desulfoluna spongiiphila TaxID=419481 RepID=UPI00125515F5|nr:DNA internalization-related competence protein ComEC/Rec2 [Desulfoluna spongiiphila]VVS93388.1 competence protein comec/rec2 [Desulfoluna spongiiphila]
MFGRTSVYHTHRVRETVLFLFPAMSGLDGRPLLFVLTGLVAGILTGHAHTPVPVSGGLFLALTACGMLAAPGRRLSALLIPLCALAGSWLIAPWADLPEPVTEAPSAPRVLSGRIEHIRLQDRDLKCTLRDVRFKNGHGLAPPCTGIRLIIKKGCTLAVAEGMHLTTRCRLRPFTSFNNPGRFDYRRHMMQKGVAAWAVVKADDVTLSPAHPVHRWKSALHHARGRIEKALFAHAPTPRSGALLCALLTGNRAHVSPSLRDLFTHTGTAHLLAISGLHLGIVATVFYVLFTGMFSHWERPLIKGHTQMLAAAATLVPVLLYALLSGMAPSTQRALTAACLVMGALALHEEADLPTTLALAAIAILVSHPPALFAVSFQLSFAAVGAILASLAQLRTPRNPMTQRTFRQRVLLFIIPPCFASFGTAPLVWYHFGYASPIGLLANLILVPMTSFGVILPGLAGVLILPLCAPLAGLLFALAGYILEGTIQGASLFAAVPGGYLLLPRPGLATTLLVMILLFSLLLSTPHKRKGPLLIAIFCLLLLGQRATTAYMHRHHNPTLRVTVLDVGQGSAAVLAFPKGKRWLVDGGFAWPGRYDVGRFAVGPYLQAAQITTLDAVVLTHPESDHMGGLIHILKNFTVKTLFLGPRPGRGALWNRFDEAATRCGTRIVHLTDRSPPMDVEGVHITCLHPEALPKGFTGDGSVNNNSLVLRLAYGDHRFLLTGDIMEKAEDRLLADAGDALKANVMVVPHHGSRSSSTRAFLARVTPSIGVISAGQTNRYGLPHTEVMERYLRAGCALYRTDLHGAVTIESNGVSLSVSTFLAPPPPFPSSLTWTQP